MDTPFPAYRGDAAYTFVCYAHADADRVYPLIDGLHASGVHLWYDEGIPPGDNWRAEISERLDRAEAMLVFVSHASLASDHCSREINFALDNGTRVIPVLLDEVELTPELRMGLGRVQMIRRAAQSEGAFRERLLGALQGKPQPSTTAQSRRPARTMAVVFGAAIALVLAAGLWFTTTNGTSEQPATTPTVVSDTHPKSVAVLPFANLSSDPEQAFFADGIAEEILNRLSRNPELHVISRTSAFSFGNRDVDLPSVAAALNVAHVVEGSVRRGGDTLRISARLVEVSGDRQLWAATYDRKLEDVFAVQDEIARSVADQLQVTLLGESAVTRQVDPRAYERYLQARQLLDQVSADTRPFAKRLLDEAITLDPDFGGPWVQLARYHVHRELQDELSPAAGQTRVDAALNRALAINPDDVDALGIRAWTSAVYARDLQTAGRLFTRALELQPTNVSTLKLAIDMALMLGRVDDAVAIGEYVVARDPLCSLCRTRLAEALYWAGRYTEAEAQSRRATQLQNQLPGATIGYAMLARGEPEQALAVFEQLDPKVGYGRYLGALLALHALGRTTAFDAMLAEAREHADPDGLPNLLASLHAQIGNPEEAFEWLDKPSHWEDYRLRLALAPVLGHDPRWRAYLERINRTPEALAAVEFRFTLP